MSPTPHQRVFVARLVGTAVFDPLGDQVGRVHDVVVLFQSRALPRAIGLVVEVTGRRRIFLPLTRVTAINPGAVITTGLLNLRRFQLRSAETLVAGELFDRTVHFRDGSGDASVKDVALEYRRGREWEITALYVIRKKTSGLLRRGQSVMVEPREVTGLEDQLARQGAGSLIASFADMKAADIADLMRDLPLERRIEVAIEMREDRLADVLEELGDEDRVAIVRALKPRRAANVLDVMQPDDAADLVSELPDDVATALLELMEPGEAEDVRRLLAYEDNTAGGLMTTEPVILGPDATVAQMLADARRKDVPPALAAIAYIVRPPLEVPTGKLLGVVHIQRALREPPHALLGTVLDTSIEPVSPDASIGTITRLLATYNLTALAVSDDDGRLLGAVSVDDVLDHLLPEDWREADDTQTDDEMNRWADG
ncbi:MAG: CBS domain-containing protein [Bowdeniella nasicola]|nr:CBS domain-containing protein [Bowdeniella nasicola]